MIKNQITKQNKTWEDWRGWDKGEDWASCGWMELMRSSKRRKWEEQKAMYKLVDGCN